METLDRIKNEAIVSELVDFALETVKQKYGTGSNDGEHPKKYHNLIHTQDVHNDTLALAAQAVKTGKITHAQATQLELSASYHDIEQDLKNGKNEVKSAEILADKMRSSGIFQDEEIEEAQKIIYATKVKNDNGALIQQVDNKDYLQQIIADADLASLGKASSVYWDRSKRLFYEKENKEEINRDEEIALCQSQLKVLGNHQFYTDEAKHLFPHQKENLNFVKNKLQELENK